MVQVDVTNFARYIYAEAFDSAGKVLNNTTIVSTFVPHADLESSCHTTQSADKTEYTPRIPIRPLAGDWE